MRELYLIVLPTLEATLLQSMEPYLVLLPTLEVAWLLSRGVDSIPSKVLYTIVKELL